MASRWIVLLALVCFCSLHPTSAVAKRIALVMGNSSYSHVASLRNPVNDADLMAATLTTAGFEVTKVIDADLRTMRKAMLDFGRALRDGAEASLFYYAGHGLQVNGENYLLPVSAKIEDQEEIEFEGVNINAFLRVMNSSDSDVNIVILDSCRNNPFATSVRSIARGLAPVRAPKGTYIAYATAPGDVAFDGEGTNSYYTAALVEAMLTPGLEIARVFRKAREIVIATTEDKQVPWESSSIIGEFYFRSGDPGEAQLSEAAEKQGRQLKLELEAAARWKEIRLSNSVVEIEKFIGKFGTTSSVDLARLRLEELNEVSVEIASTNFGNDSIRRPGSEDLSDSAEEKGFNAAKRVGTLRGWALFLQKFGGIGNWTGQAQREMNDVGLSLSQTTRSPSQQERGLKLSLGNRKDAQNQLAKLGFEVGAIDGVFGNGTRKAITLFQTNSNMPSTGYINSQTARALGIRVERDGSLPKISSTLARRVSWNDLELVDENPKIVKAIKCFDGTQLNYRVHNDKLYIAVLRENTNWRFANSWADRCKGHLVTITSKAENEIVFSLVAEDDRFFRWGFGEAGWGWKDGPWIGLVQKPGAREPGGGWHWVTNEPMKFKNWAIYHPEEWRAESDFGMFYQQIRGKREMAKVKADKWKDNPNSTAHGFLVEFELN